jgi:anti-anti-sigma regulatory factor
MSGIQNSNISDVRFIKADQNSILVEGDLKEENASDFESRVRTLIVEPGTSVILDFRGLDIEDGVALATCINSLRELRARASGLVLRGAPQMLGHNLYRIGMLEGPGAVEMVDMRLDESSGV